MGRFGPFRRIQFLTAVSFFMNVMVMLHLKNSRRVPSMSKMREASLSTISRYSRSLPWVTDRPVFEDIGCRKSIIFFGLRDHWFTFCAYEEFSQYKHMIQFPRTVRCPEVDCSVDVHHTMEAAEIRGHDIVVFTNVNSWMTPEMWDWVHAYRTDGQIWALITEESPLYVPGVQPPEKYANTSFDWVDSYRQDSDFVHPYGSYKKFSSNNRPLPIDLNQFLMKKTKFISWMGSHCETQQWDRLKFVEELGNIIPVDSYGKCGKSGAIPWNNDTAIQEVLGAYKFYLSLENSCCEEYFTEKFWRALQMGLVPVVVGAPLEHYEQFAPPGSFIHIDNFDSLAELAIELIKINTDDKAYLNYHRWRNEGKLISYGQEEQYVRPLNNETQCAMLSKLLKTDVSRQRKLEYFGRRWYGSCKLCSTKTWFQKFMHPKNYKRNHTDIWA